MRMRIRAAARSTLRPRPLLLLLLALAPGACGDGGPGTGDGEPVRIQWKLVTSWPKNFPGLGTGAENFARLVEETSNGRLRVKVYAAGELVPALEVFDAVSRGVAQLGHSAAYYEKGKLPASQFFTTIPFGMVPQEMNAWLHRGGGAVLQRELYGERGIFTLPGGTTGVQMGGWFNRRIDSLDDLRGLKMRIPGLAGEVFTHLGGASVLLPGAELYTSMQTGVIDAVEWAGPYNDRALGLQEVGEYYYYPGWHEPGSMLQFLVNREAYRELPAELQAIVAACAARINQDMLYDFSANNGTALRLLLQEGVRLLQFPEDVLEGLRRASQETLAGLVTADADAARVHRSYREFARKIIAWNELTEKSYLNLHKKLRAESEPGAGR